MSRVGLLLWPLLVPAQGSPQDPPADLIAEHRALSRHLDGTGDGLPLGAAEKVRLLRGFLARHRDRPGHPLVLQSRSRLADLYLLLRDASAAGEQFAAVLADAAPHHRDLRSRARYGQAQVRLARGETTGARDELEALARDLAGTRYGRFARIALRHLEDPPDPLRLGRPIDPIEFGRDLDGASHDTGSLRGAPALLVFWSPDHPVSVRLTERLAEVWHRARGSRRQLVALSVDGDRQRLQALVEARGWTFPVVPCDGGFLDPRALALEVTGVPISLLIGPDGTLLGQDLSPGRLAELLARSRGG